MIDFLWSLCFFFKTVFSWEFFIYSISLKLTSIFRLLLNRKVEVKWHILEEITTRKRKNFKIVIYTFSSRSHPLLSRNALINVIHKNCACSWPPPLGSTIPGGLYFSLTKPEGMQMSKSGIIIRIILGPLLYLK